MSALFKQPAYIVQMAKIVAMSFVSMAYMSQTVFAQITQGEAEDFTNSLVVELGKIAKDDSCLLYTSPSPRDRQKSRMPSSA